MRLKNVTITTNYGRFVDDVVNVQIDGIRDGHLFLSGRAVRERVGVMLHFKLREYEWNVLASTLIGHICVDERHEEAQG